MLAAGQRLRRREQFTAALRAGRRAGRGTVVVHLASTEPALVPARAGFIIPRAVGPAVIRNRVRRRLRHLVRDLLTQLPPGTALVVRALPGAVNRSYQQLGADLSAALGAARGEGLARPRTPGSRQQRRVVAT